MHDSLTASVCVCMLVCVNSVHYACTCEMDIDVQWLMGRCIHVHFECGCVCISIHTMSCVYSKVTVCLPACVKMYVYY